MNFYWRDVWLKIESLKMLNNWFDSTERNDDSPSKSIKLWNGCFVKLFIPDENSEYSDFGVYLKDQFQDEVIGEKSFDLLPDLLDFLESLETVNTEQELYQLFE